ncbi:hypothetical protein KCG44_06030 [Pacificimonas sp. WHA3]|uniref:Uncharacterized protein n=1 Tax=Pacificimonas pallii TaxID=2827236 RepID=A0ABS6SD46_9SPHN|nr:hypothetical protein [Pacificimonas pallii]MBV7256343.1 hypothetical protein [Pacificimonas pallii]
MTDILSPAQGQEQPGTGSEGIDRQLPVVQILEISSQQWASASFDGMQYEIRIGIGGLENDVDSLARLIERDLSAEDSELLAMSVPEGASAAETGTVIDVTRLGTDKTIDGAGNAVSVVTFLALSLSD